MNARFDARDGEPPEPSSGSTPHSPLRYLRVLATFARNSLVRDMSFRSNFLIECVSSISWVLMNLGFYVLIFNYTDSIGAGTGWGKYQFFAFLATTMFVNSLVQAFFMPNAEEFSELIRTGGLDFALLKPIDTQFLISMQKTDWSSLANFIFAAGLLGYSAYHLDYRPTVGQLICYPLYLVSGVAILYSLMILLAATSVWLGRNQSLYDFWFYITNFSRYPMEIYRGRIGTPLQVCFTFVVPVLIVVNVPARLITRPLEEGGWRLLAFGMAAAVVSVAASRWVFQRALTAYRSASS